MTTRDTAIAGKWVGRYPSWMYWLLFAAIAGPIGIVMHELGHFLLAHAFGFPDKSLMAAAAGTAVGVILYVNWLGPWILP